MFYNPKESRKNNEKESISKPNNNSIAFEY